ncbi:MAG: S41 family peptidase [Verrucomicrobiae bacterium]|nr:S41 family peptidase [Verrucomicrobiae bacterium]
MIDFRRQAKWVRASVALTMTCMMARAQDPEPKVAGEADLVETLNQASLQSAFQMLRQRYLERDVLSLDLLNRIALRGLLDHLGTGAELVPEKSSAAPGGSGEAELRLVSELLTNQVAYVRPASLGGDELKRFDSVLTGFQRSPAEALILDLRCPGGVDRFRNAADFASRFVATGVMLFRLERPGDDAGAQQFKSRNGLAWKKRTVVLVDGDTSPAGEVLAACLRSQLGSLIVGQVTVGRTAEYEEVPLGAGGLLRYAVAEVIVGEADREEQTFRQGVLPDLECRLQREKKLSLFAASQKAGVRPLVYEVERQRLNEAALVAGRNPELENALPENVQLQESANHLDPVIQTALDVIAAAHRLQKP